jgi:hypothetical protein
MTHPAPCESLLKKHGAIAAAAQIAERIKSRDFAEYMKAPPTNNPQAAAMPAAILNREQAGGGSRVLLIKSGVALKQQKHFRPDTRPGEYMRVQELLNAPDYIVREKHPQSKWRYRAAKKIGGKYYLLIWDAQSDGVSALVSFHRPRYNQIKRIFGLAD